MAVAKRQGREKPVKIEQRKVRGLEWEPRVEQTALLASRIYIGQAQGEEKHIKREAKGLSLSLSPTRWRAPSLFSSRLWVGMPSHLEDGFSCYFLNKIELWHRAVTLICLRAITRFVWDLRTVTQSFQDPELWRSKGFNVRHSKSLLWRDRTEENTLAWHVFP